MYQEERKKTEVLKVLLILTFIGSGLTLLSNFFIFAFFNQIKTILASQGSSYSFFGTKMDLTPFFNISPSFYFIQGLLSALSLFGAILMWNLKKEGFHLYTVAQIGLLIVPELYIRNLPFPWTEVFITFLFVFYYARLLKIK